MERGERNPDVQVPLCSDSAHGKKGAWTKSICAKPRLWLPTNKLGPTCHLERGRGTGINPSHLHQFTEKSKGGSRGRARRRGRGGGAGAGRWASQQNRLPQGRRPQGHRRRVRRCCGAVAQRKVSGSDNTGPCGVGEVATQGGRRRAHWLRGSKGNPEVELG